MQSPSPHPLAEDLHKPLVTPSAQLGCTAVPQGPHAVSAVAVVLLKKGTIFTTFSHFDRRKVKTFEASASPAARLPSPGCATQQPVPHGPDARMLACPRIAGSRPDTRAWRPRKPACSPAATSLAAYCLLILWERLHLRAWQSLAPNSFWSHAERIWVTAL